MILTKQYKIIYKYFDRVNKKMKKTIYRPNNYSLQKAVNVLNQSGVIGFPTETVYGLGGNACSDQAINKIYEIKNRPKINPLIIHVSSFKIAETLGEFSDTAKNIASKFWPGPLTILLNRKANNGISEIATAGLNSIAIRIPSNRIANLLLKKFGKPIAAPSANLSGTVSSTSASHIFDDFGSQIDMIIDDGPCLHGIESTIIDARNNNLKILREGNITKEDIFRTTNIIIDENSEKKIIAPGQLEKHYAPKASLRINVEKPDKDEFYITFGKSSNFTNSINLSRNADLTEFANKIYSVLRELDDKKIKKIAVAPIPNSGIGQAINDRLKRASK